MESFKDFDSIKDDALPEGMTGGVLATQDEDPVSMPLGIGGEAGFGAALGDPAAASKSSSKLNGALLLVVVLCVAGGTLWTMRVTGGVEKLDQSMVATEKKIDQALAKLQADKKGSAASPGNLDALFGDTDKVIASFSNDPTKRQVDVDHLQKNPFEMFVSANKSSTDQNVAAIDKVKAQRLKEIKAEFDKLQLQSLLNGAQPLAVISGKVLKEGESVGSFTVSKITPTGVTLSAEGNTYTLAMKKPLDLKN
ncbi:MAG: hypothetical protein GC162_12190 [Planctomycetes bacterium]|nr:hypothetical protein [Planctomycetota bacterium]